MASANSQQMKAWRVHSEHRAQRQNLNRYLLKKHVSYVGLLYSWFYRLFFWPSIIVDSKYYLRFFTDNNIVRPSYKHSTHLLKLCFHVKPLSTFYLFLRHWQTLLRCSLNFHRGECLPKKKCVLSNLITCSLFIKTMFKNIYPYLCFSGNLTNQIIMISCRLTS